MTEIQLLIEDEGNQHALEALLDPRYNVVVADDLQVADCYIVDEHSLLRQQETLREHKRDRHPTFVPVLLIRRDVGRIQHIPDTDGQDGPPLLDEIMTAPVEKGPLYRSIDNLVVRRDQSLALTNQYEQVEARFHGLFAAIPDPAFVLTDDARISEVNDAFCHVLGVDRTELIGTLLSDVPGIGLNSEVMITQALRQDNGGQITNRQVQYTNRDGETRTALLSVQTVLVEKTPSTVGVLADITEIQEKTERLEEFANIVAHDVRNPLQVAQARLNFLEDETTREGDHLAAIDRSLVRIEDLIDKLLTVARTGEDNIETEQFLLTPCVESAWKTVETRDATIVTEMGESVTVRGDEQRLMQLFENVFRNAIEHGGDAVTVRVGLLPDGFYVEDDGPGIPADVQGEVFQMGATTNPQGTGLGLSIVEEIVDAHSGRMAVTASSEGGARFEITDMQLSD